MADIYGISAAMKTAFKMYQQSSRATGRTTHLLNMVRDGDVVLFETRQHADTFKRELRHKRGRTDVKCIVVKDVKSFVISDDDAEYLMGYNEGEILFDHVLIERLYEVAIHQVQDRMESITQFFKREHKPKNIHRMDTRWGVY